MATYNELRGRTVYDRDHQKIGTLDDFYIDENTQLPTWLTVKTGMFGTKSSFVPLVLAHETDDGLEVAITKDEVKDAPRVDPDGRIDQKEEGRLLDYYRDVIGDEEGVAGRMGTNTETTADSRDQDASDAITRSEEELTVDKQTHETGRVHLQKYVTTEDVNFTVPVKKERVRLVQEPIEGNAGGEGVISEGSQVITLHEEEVEVVKRVVPKERVKLEKDVVEERQNVHDTIRKEKIDITGDGDEEGARDNR